jgi:hypothetical protein
MNLRFEKQHIRFRISNNELDVLLKEGILNEVLSLPQSQEISYSVKLVDEETSLKYNPNNLTLNLNQSSTKKHKDELPSREGITGEFEIENGKTLKYSFEVDVRKRK